MKDSGGEVVTEVERLSASTSDELAEELLSVLESTGVVKVRESTCVFPEARRAARVMIAGMMRVFATTRPGVIPGSVR